MLPMEMEVDDPRGWDFVPWVGPDASACIFRCLDDPADIVRAAAVSRSWRRFVVANEFSKSLCLRICAEIASFTSAEEVSRSPQPSPIALHAESSHDVELKALERDYRIYSYLSGALVSTSPSMDCILQCIGASSTDNFPDESIENTLIPHYRVKNRPSYWSSGGHDDPDAPESLTYRLNCDVCIIDEIKLQPFKAYFQYGHPIYSSKAVRFRMGHSKLPHGSDSFVTVEDENLMAIDDENYVWTYTSPEFPMLQENVLQSFKLPRPVLCIGGVVKVELLGRVQKQEADDRYYIWISRPGARCFDAIVAATSTPSLLYCPLLTLALPSPPICGIFASVTLVLTLSPLSVAAPPSSATTTAPLSATPINLANIVCHAQVKGRSLSPVFMVDTSDPAGYSVLKYLPDAKILRTEDAMLDDGSESLEWHSLAARYRQMRHLAIMNVLLGPEEFMDEDDFGGVLDEDPFV